MGITYIMNIFRLTIGILALAMLSSCGAGSSTSGSDSGSAESSSWDIYAHLNSSAIKADPLTSPVLIYDFENVSGTTVPDESGNNYDGSFSAYDTGTGRGTLITAGYRGNGVLTSEHGGVLVSNDKNLKESLHQDFAISLWFCHSDIGYTGNLRLISKKVNWDDRDGIEIEINAQDRRIRLLVQNGEYISSLPIPLDYDWHHLVAQVEGNTGSIFLDGVDFTWRDDDRDQLSQAGARKTDVDMYIGCHTSGSSPFQGTIDNVQIFSTFISADDVTTLYEGAQVGDSLLAHWEFESIDPTTFVTPDSSVNNLDATVNNGTLETGHPELGNALILDGSTTNVDCGGAKSLALTQQLSVSAWVRVDDNTADRFMRILSKKKAYEIDTGFEFEYNPVRQRLSFTGSGNKVARANGVDLGLGAWHLVTASVNGTRVKMYVDGTLITTYHDELGAVELDPRGNVQPYGEINLIQQATTNVTIGSTAPESDADVAAAFWIGALDDVRIYDYPLSDDQVLDLIPAPTVTQ